MGRGGTEEVKTAIASIEAFESCRRSGYVGAKISFRPGQYKLLHGDEHTNKPKDFTGFGIF